MFVRVIHEEESVIYKDGIYKKDDVFEVDEAIAESLMERGYVEPADIADAEIIDVEYEEVIEDEIEEEIEEEIEDEIEEEIEEEIETVKGKFDKEQLEEMPYAEIKKLASDLGIKAVGTKDELIEKICEVEVDIPVNETMTEDELPNTDMPE